MRHPFSTETSKQPTALPSAEDIYTDVLRRLNGTRPEVGTGIRVRHWTGSDGMTWELRQRGEGQGPVSIWRSDKNHKVVSVEGVGPQTIGPNGSYNTSPITCTAVGVTLRNLCRELGLLPDPVAVAPEVVVEAPAAAELTVSDPPLVPPAAPETLGWHPCTEQFTVDGGSRRSAAVLVGFCTVPGSAGLPQVAA